ERQLQVPQGRWTEPPSSPPLEADGPRRRAWTLGLLAVEIACDHLNGRAATNICSASVEAWMHGQAPLPEQPQQGRVERALSPLVRFAHEDPEHQLLALDPSDGGYPFTPISARATTMPRKQRLRQAAVVRLVNITVVLGPSVLMPPRGGRVVLERENAAAEVA